MPMAMGVGNHLLFIGWGAGILLFTAQEFNGDSKNFGFFPGRDERVQCSFRMGLKVEGIFHTGNEFLANFSNGRMSFWVCDTGVYLVSCILS